MANVYGVMPNRCFQEVVAFESQWSFAGVEAGGTQEHTLPEVYPSDRYPHALITPLSNGVADYNFYSYLITTSEGKQIVIGMKNNGTETEIGLVVNVSIVG